MKERKVYIDEVGIDDDLSKHKKNIVKAIHNLTFYKDFSGIELLREVKFSQSGYNPENPEKGLNFIEQVNQTFTYMVTYRAVEWLRTNGYDNQTFKLSLGPRSGYDIENDNIVAEVFSAVSPSNNRKLKKDIEKVTKEENRKRFVFYMSPEAPVQNEEIQQHNGKDVVIVYFPLDALIDEYKKMELETSS